MTDHDIALDPLAGTAVAREFDARCRQAGPNDILPVPDGMSMREAYARADTHARAHVSPPLGLESAQAGLFAPAEPVAEVNVCILALDLGTRTGYAVRKRDGQVVHGTQSFTPRASWAPGQRWQRFRAWLSQLIVANQVHGIVFERVVFGHSSASSSDVYGGFKALVEMLADQHGLTLDSVAVPTVKKHWTGSGRADKAGMIAEARRRGFNPEDDNSADALAVLDWAVAEERKHGVA